ncbi:hypothetical protein V2P20_00075 [Methylobacter sp. Wu1]|uniref:hypothetical protein n=1 Tax=Methylobacter sp. Wu1 TaxID=3119359 RepID=UPI002F9270C1
MRTPNYRNSALCFIVLTGLFFVFSDQLSALFKNNPSDNEVIKEGLSIALAIDPVQADKIAASALHEGQPARLQFTVRDTSSKEPVKGLHPAVWLDRQNPQEQNLSCKDRINSYLQSKLAFQPDINLNSYFVLALNNKASISVIDPMNGFGGSKMITRIRLNSPGVDWALSKDNKKLYVATPLSREVAVIDTGTWQVKTFLSFAASPTRLALQPDGHYLWVGLETTDNKSSADVSAVDTEKNQVAASIATGKGGHEFAFSADSRMAYVSNADNQTVAVIDTAKLANHNAVKSMARPVALAFSTLSKTLYAATESGRLLVIDAEGQAGAPIETGSPLKALRFSPDGRWGFALSQRDNKVFIIDASVNRLAQTVEAGAAPDQITFTDHFAYVRSTANETVSMLQLDALGKNAPAAVTTFPGGQSAPGSSGLLSADAIVPTPERNAVVVANPADKSVYYYTEGMAAPMGNFENFGMNPMAVMIVDKSLQETAPGVYTGTAQLPPAGRYSVSVLLNNPTVYHCFAADIAPDPELAKSDTQPVKVEYLLNSKEVPVGAPVSILVKVNHAEKNNVSDLQLLIFRIPGQWQQRLLAKPLGDGLYQADITPTETGVYQVFAQSPSLNFTFEQQPMLTFRAIRPEIATAQVKELAP